MRTIGWTHKKTPVVAKREKFVELQLELDASRPVFLDESEFRLGSSPRYGSAPRGEDAPGKSVQGSWTMLTIALDGFLGRMTVTAGTSILVFDAFVAQQLLPNLRPGDIVIMNNFSAHKNTRIPQRSFEVGCTVFFTPPDSPEFNLIEKIWMKIKDFSRRLPTLRREAFDHAVASAMENISRSDIRGWVMHAGFQLTST